MPITWRNVDGNRGAIDAALIMRGAGQSINSGFDALSGVITDQKALRDRNFDTQLQNNTAAAKDIFAKYTDVASLEKAQADGSLAAQLQGLGPNIDRDVVRSGGSDRLLALRNEANATYEYDLNNLKKEAAPLEQEFYKNLYLNTPDGDKAAKQLMTDNGDLFAKAGIAGVLAKDFTSTNRAELEQSRSDVEYLEGRALKQSNENFDTLLGEGLDQFESAADVRRFVAENSQGLGIPSNVLNKRIAEADAAFETRHGLTTAQREEQDMVAGAASAQASNEIAQYTLEMEAQEGAYAELNTFDAAAAPPASVGDVMKTAEGAGFDRTGLSSDVNTAIEEFKAEFKDAGIPAGKVGAIAKQAMERMGSPNPGIIFDPDLSPEAFKANMRAVYQESQQREAARNSLENARAANLKRVQEAQARAAAISAGNLAKYRGDNLSRTLR